MKKAIVIIALALVVVLSAVAFAGCTESYKQDGLKTTKGPVSDNGGMAVVYGNYLYFVNGYAGSSVDNTFGNVTKGAIARVELENGLPKGNAQIVVSKNVYGTDTNYGGLYIVDDYIYYASTNTDLNSSGSARTTSGVLMRSAVDGSYTERIATFDDHSFVFTVVGKKLTYIRNNNVYAVDLTDKKFGTKTVDTSIMSSYLLTEDYLYYTQYKNGHSDNQVIKAYPLAGGDVKVLIEDDKLNGENEEKEYTVSLLSAIDEENSKVTLFYSVTDNGINTPDTGIYAYTFDKASFAFEKNDAKRFTRNSTSTTNLAYTKFYKAGPYYLGFASNKLDFFTADGSRPEGALDALNIGSTITVFEIEQIGDDYYLWYISDNALYRIKILEKTEEGYAIVETSTKKMFSASYDTTYLSLDRVGNLVCYFNSSISNNAYYYELSDEAEDTAAGKILGILTDTDRIAAF